MFKTKINRTARFSFGAAVGILLVMGALPYRGIAIFHDRGE
jgi:hypothetical protein